jgi:hypothetical protein
VLLFEFPVKSALMTMLAPYEIACLAVATRIPLREPEMRQYQNIVDDMFIGEDRNDLETLLRAGFRVVVMGDLALLKMRITNTTEYLRIYNHENPLRIMVVVLHPGGSTEPVSIEILMRWMTCRLGVARRVTGGSDERRSMYTAESLLHGTHTPSVMVTSELYNKFKNEECWPFTRDDTTLSNYPMIMSPYTGLWDRKLRNNRVFVHSLVYRGGPNAFENCIYTRRLSRPTLRRDNWLVVEGDSALFRGSGENLQYIRLSDPKLALHEALPGDVRYDTPWSQLRPLLPVLVDVEALPDLATTSSSLNHLEFTILV